MKTQIEARLATGRQQTAEHVACMSVELGEMAANAEMRFLKHLLDMAVEKAVQQSILRRRWTDTLIRPAELAGACLHDNYISRMTNDHWPPRRRAVTLELIKQEFQLAHESARRIARQRLVEPIKRGAHSESVAILAARTRWLRTIAALSFLLGNRKGIPFDREATTCWPLGSSRRGEPRRTPDPRPCRPGLFTVQMYLDRT